MNDTIISVYSLEQAIEDGVLVRPFDEYKEKFMQKHVEGKPIVATAHLFNGVKAHELLDIWNKFIVWRKDVMPTLPEEDRMFSIQVNGERVWVDETENQITFMYPADY